MLRNDYHFITHWQVAGTTEEVYAIISNAGDLPRWWPAVYLDVQEIGSGTEQRISLLTKGWLPYTLRWQFRTVATDAPRRIVLEASGDFEGRGIWTFTQDGPCVNITYDWRIRADKPLLRYGSLLFKPIFALNHRWAMQTGEESLKLELAHQHATTPAERTRIPAPPPPTTTSPVPLLLGIIAGSVIGGRLLYRFAWRWWQRNRSLPSA